MYGFNEILERFINLPKKDNIYHEYPFISRAF
jgi:hypothetical protein